MNLLSFKKVFYHLDHLNDYMARGDCYPVHMIIGLTNCCNHRCVWCYGYNTIASHFNENDFAPVEALVGAIKQAAACGLRSLTFVGTGEPTLHPRFAEIALAVKGCKVDLGLFTNGSRLDEKNRTAILATHTFIRLSCSAATREEHNQLHHGGREVNDFPAIVAAIRKMVQERGAARFPTIGVQFGVNHLNWQSLPSACRLWKEVGVDYFAIKPIYKNPHIQEHEENQVPLDEVLQLMAEVGAEESASFKVFAKAAQFERVLRAPGVAKGYETCHGQAFNTFLDPDGKLYVCGNLHGQEEYVVGNVWEKPFREVWDGERRRRVLQSLRVAECPQGCRMDPLNLIIEDLRHPDPDLHPNFL